MRRLALIGLFAAGCASTYPTSAEPVDPEHRIDESEAELHREEAQLKSSFADARPVDCARACALAGNICTLAERICTMTARLPATPARAARCANAHTSCQSARSRVATACRCEQKPPP